MLALGAGGAVAMDEMSEGPALSLSGSAGLGATFTGEMKDGTTIKEKAKTEFNHFAKITFKGSGVTDGGLTFGAKVRVNTDKVDDAEVHIGGEMWTLTVGDNDKASDLGYSLGDVGFDGNLGVDDVAEKFYNQFSGGDATKEYGVKNAARARLDLTFGVAKVAVSVGQTAGSKYKAKKDDKFEFHTKTGLTGTFTKRTSAEIAALPAGDQPKARAENAIIDAITSAYEDVTHSLPTTAYKVDGNILEGVSGSTYYLTRKNPVITTGAIATPSAGNAYNVWRIVGSNDLELAQKWADAVIARNKAITAYNADQAKDAEEQKGLKDPNPATSPESKAVLAAENAYLCERATKGVDCGRSGEEVEDGGKGGADTKVSGGNVTASNTSLHEYTKGMAAKMATKQKTNWAAGASFDLGPATLGFGIDSEKMMQASVGGEFGQFGGSLFYAQQEVTVGGVDKDLTGLGAEFKMTVQDSTTINAVLTRATMDGAEDVSGFGAGVKHDLGGGATVEAGFAQVADVNKASVGVTMSF